MAESHFRRMSCSARALAAVSVLVTAAFISSVWVHTLNGATTARVERGVTYAIVGDAVLKMDIYYPDSVSGLTPAVVFVHGGALVAGNRSFLAPLQYSRELITRGYLVASIDYRLAPRYRWPAQIEDTKCAIRYLRANANKYGLDPNRIGALGASAGGHLVAMLGITDSSAGFDNSGGYFDQSSRVQVVVDMYGTTELATGGANVTKYFGDWFGTPNPSAENLRKASPITYVSADSAPFLILHGEKDDMVPPSQSQVFYQRLKAAGVTATLVMVKNAGHGFRPAGGPIYPSEEEITRMVADFFDKHLKALEAQVDTTREDSLMKDALRYIEASRKGTTQIQIIDEATGKPVAGSQVQYQQTSHDFIFSTNYGGALFRSMKLLGLEWSGDVRLNWAEIQPAKGTYNYSKPDRMISLLQRNQTVRLWASFAGLLTDWNYLESPRPPGFADIEHISDPTVFAQYKDLVYDFVFNMVTHYKRTFQAYTTQIEINWPDDVIKHKLSTWRLWTVEQAVELDKVVANAIRRADPSAIIMLGTSTASGGALGKGVDALQFARMCLQADVDVDMVALEAYPFDGSPAFFYDYVKELGKLGKPVFIHETGYPSVKPRGLNVDDRWLSSWKWHTFNEHVQALWIRYIFTLAFGMKEVAGVGLLCIRDGDPSSLYATTVSSLFVDMGVLTVASQPKESFTMLGELMANFTTSGQARTDDNGMLTIRGYAGEYSVKVSGYEPITSPIRVSEGKSERITIRVSASTRAMQQQQDYFRLSDILVAMVLAVGIAVGFLVWSRRKGRK